MTKEELLSHRVMVMLPYPDSPFTVGDILQLVLAVGSLGTGNFYGKLNHSAATHVISKEEVLKCKEIFRLMPWYEGRKPEDMPEYMIVVKDRINRNDGYKGFVFKTEPGNFNYFHSTGFTCHNSEFVTGFDNIIIECFMPATKEEYEAFINQQ